MDLQRQHPSPNNMTYYKVLNPDGTPVNGGIGKWPLPRGKRPGTWLKITGDLIPCRNGLHICTDKMLLNWLKSGAMVFEVEPHPKTDKVEQIDKIVVRQARLLRQLKCDDRILRLFACDCAERALKREKLKGIDIDQRSWNAIVVSRRFADGLASIQELRSANAAAYAAVYTTAYVAGNSAGNAAAYAAANAAAYAAAYAATAYAAANAATADARSRGTSWQVSRLMDYLYGRRG